MKALSKLFIPSYFQKANGKRKDASSINTLSFTALGFLTTLILSGPVQSATPKPPQVLCLDGDCVTTDFASKTNKKKLNPGHYMLLFFNKNSETPYDQVDRIKGNSNFKGIQKQYLWRNLEPSKNNYTLSQIRQDLDYVRSIGKQLVLQIMIIGPQSQNFLPKYLLNDPEYDGGVMVHVRNTNMPPTKWVAKRWNRPLQERLGNLYDAIAAEFDNDPNLEAVNIPESSAAVPCPGKPGADPTFTAEGMVEEMKYEHTRLAGAFKKTQVFRYLNWMRCGPITLLGDLAKDATSKGIGFGGPDTHPAEEAMRDGVYAIYPEYSATNILAQSVQYRNWDRKWPNGDLVTGRDMLDFIVKDLQVDYIFWLQRQPQFDEQVIPLVNEFPNPFPVKNIKTLLTK